MHTLQVNVESRLLFAVKVVAGGWFLDFCEGSLLALCCGGLQSDWTGTDGYSGTDGGTKKLGCRCSLSESVLLAQNAIASAELTTPGLSMRTVPKLSIPAQKPVQSSCTGMLGAVQTGKSESGLRSPRALVQHAPSGSYNFSQTTEEALMNA